MFYFLLPSSTIPNWLQKCSLRLSNKPFFLPFIALQHPNLYYATVIACNIIKKQQNRSSHICHIKISKKFSKQLIVILWFSYLWPHLVINFWNQQIPPFVLWQPNVLQYNFNSFFQQFFFLSTLFGISSNNFKFFRPPRVVKKGDFPVKQYKQNLQQKKKVHLLG